MRQISTRKYIIAFVITLAVFIIGMLAGVTVEKARANKADFLNLEQTIAYSSLQLQEAYLDSFENKSCSAMDVILANNLVSLDKAMRKVTDYEKNSLSSKEELKLNLRNYFLTEIRYLMLLEKVEKACNSSAAVILYFYGADETNEQGYALDYIKKVFGDGVLIFSFDYEMRDEEPMIDVLLKNYNITIVPSLVIEGERLSGFVDEDELYKIMEKKLA
ncbi:hypothetical protein HZB88_01195 [archaeon]|nr:hypothetical protein [archaeon]